MSNYYTKKDKYSQYDKNTKKNDYTGKPNRLINFESKPILDENDIDSDDVKIIDSFENMNLKESLLRGIYSFGFTKPSPIQQKAFDPITNHKNLIAQSRSGTGKTAAFAIGMLQNVDEKSEFCEAIIISPTRELANQTYQVVSELGKYMEIYIALAIGGDSIKDTQNNVQKAHIVIGTPGRIADMIKRKYLNSTNIKMLIMDEADELLRKEFNEQIYEIFSTLPNETQICLFSATRTQEMMDMTKNILKDPINILLKQEQLTLEGIEQYHIFCREDKYKLETLCDLYQFLSINQSIIYVNTREKAEKLEKELTGKKFTVSMMHAKMPSDQRSGILQQFRIGKSRVLITTDLLSRGIDIQSVSIVINYDLPINIESYLHRIGRSGRHGRKGLAINLLISGDEKHFEQIEKYYKITINPMPTDGFDSLIDK